LNQAKIKKAVFPVHQEHFLIVKNKNVNYVQIISSKILKVNQVVKIALRVIFQQKMDKVVSLVLKDNFTIIIIINVKVALKTNIKIKKDHHFAKAARLEIGQVLT
jgi:hypothetical protein